MNKSAIGISGAIIILLLSLAIRDLHGQAETYDPLTSPVSAAERSLARRSNDFGFDLFRRLAAENDPDSNILISPLSVSFALAMAYNGAAGKTKYEISRTLRLPDMPDNVMNDSYRGLMKYFTDVDTSVAMNIANSAWYLPGVLARQGFIDKMKHYFDAEIRELNFTDPAGVDTINNWVADHTDDRIPQIVQPPLDPAIVMILINAVYFNAPWATAFDSERTRPADFHLADGSVIPCSMMHRLDSIGYADGESYTVAELSYGNGSYSMLLILPKPDHFIDDVIESFSRKAWEELTSAISPARVDLGLPRFSFSDDHALDDVLQAMGMELPFTSQADFSNMVEGGGIWIDSVIHKTFVKVEETGTEAAAATAVMMRKGLNRLSLVFDRPFLFAIRERESDVILFIGKVVNPVFKDSTE